jgi:cobalt-precorrin 5A hydrolase
MTRVAIGIGASSSASAEDILQLIYECAGELKSETILATLDRRSAIVSRVADELGLRLVLLPAHVLAEVREGRTHSALSASTTGSGSVAEAAALASLGPGARLIQERRIGNRCTCALAVLP